MYRVLFLIINNTLSYNKYNNIKIQGKHLYLKMSNCAILMRVRNEQRLKMMNQGIV